MKNLFTLLLLFVFTFSYCQSPYCVGWEKGYQKGLDSCLEVGVTPVCPLPEIGADSYNDGYGMGYAKAKQKCNSSSRTTKLTGISGKADPTLVDGAKDAYSGANSHVEVSDEAADAIGQGVVALLIAKKIKNAKRDLRQLPDLYREFPNLKTAFEIVKATAILGNYEYKIKSDNEEDVKLFEERIYSTYGFVVEPVLNPKLANIESLITEKTQKVILRYEVDWSTYKRENKEKAKEEENRLKDYLKTKNKKSKKRK